MPQNYAIRISFAFDEIARLVSEIACKAEKVAVYEHVKDKEVSRTHCHMAVYGCVVSAERIKQIARDLKINCQRSDWSFKESYKVKSTKEVVPMTLENMTKYLTYMSKGKYDPKYLKEITKDECNMAKAQWVQFEKRANMTRDQQIWFEFLDDVGGELKDFKAVKAAAIQWVFSKYGVWRRQIQGAEANMLAITYCMHANILMFEDVETKMAMF